MLENKNDDSLTKEKIEQMLKTIIAAEKIVGEKSEELDQLIEEGVFTEDSRKYDRFVKKFIAPPENKSDRLLKKLANYASQSKDTKKLIEGYFESFQPAFRVEDEEENEATESVMDTVYPIYTDYLADKKDEIENDYADEEIRAANEKADELVDKNVKNTSTKEASVNEKDVFEKKEPKAKAVKKAEPHKEEPFDEKNVRNWIRQIAQKDLDYRQRFKIIGKKEKIKHETLFDGAMQIKDIRDRMLKSFFEKENKWYQNKAITDKIISSLKIKNIQMKSRNVGKRQLMTRYNQQDCKMSIEWIKNAVKTERLEALVRQKKEAIADKSFTFR